MDFAIDQSYYIKAKQILDRMEQNQKLQQIASANGIDIKNSAQLSDSTKDNIATAVISLMLAKQNHDPRYADLVKYGMDHRRTKIDIINAYKDQANQIISRAKNNDFNTEAGFVEYVEENLGEKGTETENIFASGAWRLGMASWDLGESSDPILSVLGFMLNIVYWVIYIIGSIIDFLIDSIKTFFGKLRRNSMLNSIRNSSSEFVYTNIELEKIYKAVKEITDDADFISDKLRDASIDNISRIVEDIKKYTRKHEHRFYDRAGASIRRSTHTFSSFESYEYPDKTYDKIAVSRLFEIIEDINGRLDNSKTRLRDSKRIMMDLKKEFDRISNSNEVGHIDVKKATDDINAIKSEYDSAQYHMRKLQQDLSMLRITQEPEMNR